MFRNFFVRMFSPDVGSGTAAASAESAPASPPPVGIDEFTPEEKAYFESRGKNTDGLLRQNGRAPAETSENGAARAAPKADPSPASEDGDEDGVAEIVVEDDGTLRDKKTGHFVSKSAFLRVKGEAKNLKSENQKLRDNVIAARERTAILLEAQGLTERGEQKKTEDPKPLIDPKEDIFGFASQMVEKVKELEAKLAETKEETAARLDNNETHARFKADITSFASKEPAFTEAFSYLAAQQERELELMGYSDPAERQTMIGQQLKEFATRALKAGKSPAEALFALAGTRGYQAKKPEPKPDPKNSEAAKEIERINNLKTAAASLSGAGSGGVGEQLTASRLASMSDNEYYDAMQNYVAKYGRGAWNKLIGQR